MNRETILREALFRLFQSVRTLRWCIEDIELGLSGSARMNLDWAEAWARLTDQVLENNEEAVRSRTFQA